MLPLHPGMELDVREHAFFALVDHISYSFVGIKGSRIILSAARVCSWMNLLPPANPDCSSCMAMGMFSNVC